MTSMHEFLLFLLIFGHFLVLLVPFGILTNYPNTNSCIGSEMTLNRLYMKFSEKNLWFKWLRQFLLALFYLIFGFCLFFVVFTVND